MLVSDDTFVTFSMILHYVSENQHGTLLWYMNIKVCISSLDSPQLLQFIMINRRMK